MKILLIGSGGREHALAWHFAKFEHQVWAHPGSDGMAHVATLLPRELGGIELAAWAVTEKIDLVVVGPEAPLVAGLADEMRDRGLCVFGPGRMGAQLEGSKQFSKEFFARHSIPTGKFWVCHNMDEATSAIFALRGNCVVKADGLAAGKGVVVCAEPAAAIVAAREMLELARFGAAGRTVLIEEKLQGREVSVMALCDGKSLCVLPPVQDHKRLGEGDTGPNTGGMGTISPPPWVTETLQAKILHTVLEPTVQGLLRDGLDYRGVLYAGIMVSTDGDSDVNILEYNCRFGDPETQAVLPRIKQDLAPILLDCASGNLRTFSVEVSPKATACVVLATPGYPMAPTLGGVIRGLSSDGQWQESQLAESALIFHAGTSKSMDGWVTAGGRTLNVVSWGENFEVARGRAYGAIDHLQFVGMQVRRDIGHF